LIKAFPVRLSFTCTTRGLRQSTWATEGLATATDSKILDVGRQEGMVVVTLDADFHVLLALSGATGPSVIRVRIEGLRGEDLARLLVSVLQICGDDLLKGAMVSVTENGVRIRRLPVPVK